MKTSYQIETELGESAGKYKYLIDSDRETLDKLDPYDLSKINYLNRLNTIVDLVKSCYQNKSDQLTVGEFGSAQGIISITLAESRHAGEAGFKVFAFDINSNFLEYAKLKDDKNLVTWQAGEINDLDFDKNSLDVAILGEVIEHCAYPEAIVAKVLEFVKPGGFLIVTTPNANRIRTTLPHFSKYFDKEKRRDLEKWQFGPDSSNHLFLFSKNEISLIVPKNAKIIKTGYLGGSMFVVKHNLSLIRLVPLSLLTRLLSLFNKLGPISDVTCHNLYALVQKEA